MSRIGAILAGLLLLAGCTISSNTVTKATEPKQSIDVRSGAIYAYTFLDLREHFFGPSMLAAVNRQMTEKFASMGVKAKVLAFKQSEVGRYYPITPASSNIPVDQVIAANAGDEAATGARFRLIVFPLSTEANGAWFSYDVRWDLVDIATNRTVWTVRTHGRRLNMWYSDEEPEGRATTFLDGFFQEMKSAKIL